MQFRSDTNAGRAPCSFRGYLGGIGCVSIGIRNQILAEFRFIDIRSKLVKFQSNPSAPPPTAKLVQSPTWPNGNSLAPMEMNLNLGREYAGINYNRSQCNLIKIADSYLVNWVLRVLSDFTERFHRRQSKRKPIVLKREIRWVHSSSHIYWRAITSDIKC